MRPFQRELMHTCSTALAECHRVVEVRCCGEAEPEGEVAQLLLAIRHGVDTHRAAELLLEAGLVVSAFAVSRGFAESDIALRWASMQPDGPERLCSHRAGEVVRWSKRFQAALGAEAPHFPILSDKTILRLMATSKGLPDVAQMLEDIFQRDGTLSSPGLEGNARKIYAGMFYALHFSAHAHPSILDNFAERGSVHDLDVFLWLSCQLILRAAESLTGADLSETVRRCTAAGLERQTKETEHGQH